MLGVPIARIRVWPILGPPAHGNPHVGAKTTPGSTPLRCHPQWDHIGVILGYIWIMEKKMETTIMGYIGIIGYILG